MAGNTHLAEWARAHNSNVHVVPSTVSLRSYRPRPSRTDSVPPVVGWTGSHSSAQYLGLVEEPLRRLRERVDFRLLLIGAGNIQWPGLDVECRPWRRESEVEDLWDMDVGIMPLPDEPWARGKCGMKAVQYMGAGLPAVVSPIGVNREIVTPGLDGEHAAGPDDWVAALERLLRDASLRRRMGAAAHDTVSRRYSAESQAPRVAAILRAAAAGPTRAIQLRRRGRYHGNQRNPVTDLLDGLIAAFVSLFVNLIILSRFRKSFRGQELAFLSRTYTWTLGAAPCGGDSPQRLREQLPVCARVLGRLGDVRLRGYFLAADLGWRRDLRSPIGGLAIWVRLPLLRGSSLLPVRPQPAPGPVPQRNHR